jgi:hypothetical protein
MVYLMKSECREGTWYKVGYTTNLVQRLIPYFTHNPQAKLVETAKTQRKTRHALEIAIHNEIQAMGYGFKVAENGSITEWFFVPAGQEKEFEHKGLAQFKAMKGRTIYKAV